MLTLRYIAGFSQEAFADRCGFAGSYMSPIERGRANPSPDAIETLTTGLIVSVRDRSNSWARGHLAYALVYGKPPKIRRRSAPRNQDLAHGQFAIQKAFVIRIAFAILGSVATSGGEHETETSGDLREGVH